MVGGQDGIVWIMDLKAFSKKVKSLGLYLAVGEDITVQLQLDPGDLPCPMVAAAFQPDVSNMDLVFFLSPTGDVMSFDREDPDTIIPYKF